MHKKIILLIALLFANNVKGMIRVEAKCGKECYEILFPKQRYVHLAASPDSGELRNEIAKRIAEISKLQTTTLTVRHVTGEQFPWDWVADGAVIKAIFTKKVDFRVMDCGYNVVFDSVNGIECCIESCFSTDMTEFSDEYCEEFCKYSKRIPKKMVNCVNFGNAKFNMNPYRPVLTTKLMFYLREKADYFAQFEGEHEFSGLSFWLGKQGFTIFYGPSLVNDLEERLKSNKKWAQILDEIRKIRPLGERDMSTLKPLHISS